MIAISCMVAFLLTAFNIPFFTKKAKLWLKDPTQPIRNDLIIDHSAKKNVMPLGGLAMFVSFTISLLILMLGLYFKSGIVPSSTVLISFAIICIIFIIGFLDDLAKITKRSIKGLSGKLRFWVEFAIGLVFAYIIVATPTMQHDISIAVPIPFYGIISYAINPWLYIVFKAFIFVACLNAFNITDGLDGLAMGQFLQFAIAFLAIFLIQIVSGVKLGSGGLTIMYFLSILSFVGLAFLCFNSNPASIFMGDSGSLMIGSVVAICTMLCNFELSLIFLAFIPLCETLSVILQVTSFKLRKGKRIFKIAPIHHHFEATGHKETKIVYTFLVISIAVSSLFIGTVFLN